MVIIKKYLVYVCFFIFMLAVKSPQVSASPLNIRLGGIDRYETAIKISKDGWSQSDNIILVSGENFPDAISAAPLAKKYNAPILITESKKLNSQILGEIQRLGAKDVYIVGGTGVISESIYQELKNINIQVNRISGQDRYETSVKVAEKIGTSNGIVLASGENFPDALSIASVAAIKQMPILLTRSKELPYITKEFINNNVINNNYIVGGTAVVGDNITNDLTNAKRLSGTDRYETNLSIVNEFLGDLNFNNVYLAYGQNFPDALAGSAAAAKDSAPIILSNKTKSNSVSIIRTKEDSISLLKILGGTSGISDYLVKSIFVSEKIVLGYTTYYSPGDNSSYNSLVKNPGLVDEIATDTYVTDGLGNIKGSVPTNQLDYANNNKIEAYAMISNNFDSKIAKSLLESAENRQRLIENILSVLKENNYSGVNIDLESIYSSNRSQFTNFMRELYATLNPQGLTITVAVPAKTWDNPNDSWSGAYDYEQIGKYSDKVILMTYDEHWAGGQAGAVASIDWVEKVVKYATTVIPKEKLLLGLAAYGYDWPSNGVKGQAYSVSEAYSVASKYGSEIKWDSKSQSPYFKYTDSSGVYHEVWFENGTSIGYKLDLVNNYELGGISIWRLGLENSDYWETIRTKLNR